MYDPDNKILRYVIGALSVAFIIYMWVEKDIASIYSTMPAEQVVPMIATTVLVSLAKVGAITGGILLVKWIIGKFQQQKD